MPGIEAHQAPGEATRGSFTMTFQSSNWKVPANEVAQAAATAASRTAASRRRSPTRGSLREGLLDDRRRRPPAVGGPEQDDEHLATAPLGPGDDALPGPLREPGLHTVGAGNPPEVIETSLRNSSCSRAARVSRQRSRAVVRCPFASWPQGSAKRVPESPI